MNPLVVRSAIVASLGGLIFGFDTAVISGTTDALKEIFHLSNSGLGFTVAIALIGTIVGALCAGKLTDMFRWRRWNTSSAWCTTTRPAEPVRPPPRRTKG